MASVSGASFGADQPALPVAQASGREAELLRKAQAGDRGAYGQLVIEYQNRLYNGVLRLVGDREEALELTQETFTRGLEKLESFRGESSPYTWLFRIGMNLAISRLRTVQRRRTFSLDRPGINGHAKNAARDEGQTQAAGLVDRVARSPQPSPPEQLEQRERGEAVLAALGRLDPDYRAVLVMRDIEGFDYQQMAQVLELPLGTLKSRLFRARLALRDEMRTYMK